MSGRVGRQARKLTLLGVSWINWKKLGYLRKNRGQPCLLLARTDYPMFGDLLSMVAKTKGLGAAIIVNRSKIGKVNSIMFSGRFARGKTRKHDDDVDILVVGDVVLPELATLIRTEESKRGKEINYTVMGKEEFDFRKKRRDPFLLESCLEAVL